jgi:hypothetical protein
VARHPAAFINCIAEEGTKEEAVKYLQQTWDDYVDLRAVMHAADVLRAAQKAYLAVRNSPDKEAKELLGKAVAMAAATYDTQRARIK